MRPEGNANTELPTGEIEVVVAEQLEVLSASGPLPFQIDERVNVGEETRLKYRYLDLRRPGPAAALRLRSEVNRVARTLLAERGFVEIETPTLTRSTPEGARDFLVPARLKPGCWYALPQSPQLFKQLLMVAGMERYYQIARCYRDEDFRADRQPEFTQLDIEMSFVDQEDVIELTESLITAIWRLIGVEVKTPVQRLTYADAMNRFGTDKPDLRFGHEIVELTSYFAETPFRVFQAEYVGAVVMPGGASQPRRQLDAWQEFARQRGHRGLAYVLVGEDGSSADRWPRTSRSRSAAGWPLRPVPRRGTASSLRPARVPWRSRCSVPLGWKSVVASGSSTRTPGRFAGWSIRHCSSRRAWPWQLVMSPSEQAPGLRYTMPLRRRRTWRRSTSILARARVRVRHRL